MFDIKLSTKYGLDIDCYEVRFDKLDGRIIHIMPDGTIPVFSDTTGNIIAKNLNIFKKEDAEIIIESVEETVKKHTATTL